MGQRMVARRRGSVEITGGTDEVSWGISLPSGTRVHSVSGKMEILATALAGIDSVRGYAVEGWVLPLVDPDAAATYTSLWDALVPKDTDVQDINLDTISADNAPFYEPGEADWFQLLKIGLQPKRVFQRIRNISAGGHGEIILDTTLKYLPRDSFRVAIKPFSVSQPSVLVFGVASPAMDDTNQTGHTALSEKKWGQLKYMTHTMEQAMLHLVGLTTAAEEATALSSFELATALLQEHLEPDVNDDPDFLWDATVWHSMHDIKVNHEVVGTFGNMTLDLGR